MEETEQNISLVPEGLTFYKNKLSPSHYVSNTDLGPQSPPVSSEGGEGAAGPEGGTCPLSLEWRHSTG